MCSGLNTACPTMLGSLNAVFFFFFCDIGINKTDVPTACGLHFITYIKLWWALYWNIRKKESGGVVIEEGLLNEEETSKLIPKEEDYWGVCPESWAYHEQVKVAACGSGRGEGLRWDWRRSSIVRFYIRGRRKHRIFSWWIGAFLIKKETPSHDQNHVA